MSREHVGNRSSAAPAGVGGREEEKRNGWRNHLGKSGTRCTRGRKRPRSRRRVGGCDGWCPRRTPGAEEEEERKELKRNGWWSHLGRAGRVAPGAEEEDERKELKRNGVVSPRKNGTSCGAEVGAAASCRRKGRAVVSRARDEEEE